jgi:hypothetical protein
MATKSKAKKPAKRKASKRKAAAKPKTPPIAVPNHRFEPGSEVGFYPLSSVGVERELGREPIPDPTKTAKVAEDGTLEVWGLGGGVWIAAAQTGENWRYFQFSVK